MEFLSRAVKAVLFKNATPAAISDDTTLEQFLEHTKASMDKVQRMLIRNADGSQSRLRVNGSQCKYLAEKLNLAVHTAVLRYSEGSPVSQGEKTHRLNDFKLLHSVACAAENFIQNCCTGAWVVAAFLMPNVSQDVLSISFDLAVLANFFSGNFTMEVESVYRAEASVVTERAASDRRLLLRNLMALLRTREDNTSKEYVLAELLVKRLESGEVYCTEIANLKEGDLLGEGGFAAVYKSKWLEIDVAAKTFKAVWTDLGPSPPPEFQEEVSLLKRLSHPNVASMFCYAEGERECSIVMELMDRDLFKLIRNIMKDKSKKHPFSMFEAVDIMLQVGKGVEYLHEMNIVHRDLKAANILVKQLGNGGDGESKSILAKVADVGISKAKENSITSSAQTLNTGTTRWMAPEVIQPTGKQEVVSEDPNVKKYYPYRCDSYGFGMVCYEILAGREPYDDLIRKPSQVKEKILSGERPELPEHCLPELKNLIRRCWSQEPSERPRLDEICAKLRKIRFHLLFSGAGSTAYFSRIKSMFEPMAESSSATSSATFRDDTAPEQFLKFTKACEDRVQGMLVQNDDGSMSHLKINNSQCTYVAEKLKMVVQEAEKFPSRWEDNQMSEEEVMDNLNEFRLLYNVACGVENFIQNCCKDAWVAAAFLIPNMSQDVLNLILDLALLEYIFFGSYMKFEVEDVYREEASVVAEKAATDRDLVVRNVKELLRTGEKTSAEYQLAVRLLKRLETPGAYRTDIDSLTEKKVIVKGTSANLYKSKWLGIDVALKTFKAVKTDHGPSSPLEFQAEVSIVGGLSHPNLASVFGYAEDKGDCSIVMELMDCDLSELIRQIMEDRSKEHPFSIIEAVNIMLEVGKGVEYLHEMKIVHGDLKAANILVKQLGNWRDGESKSILVKVGDFGLSKTKEKSMTYSMQTTNMGTARWMAPEVIQMRRNVGQEEDSRDTKVLKYPRQSDVFSFGMVCYEILTGRQPYFEVESQNEVKKMILRGDRPVLPEHCFFTLKDLIKRCWSQDASKRPRFREICEELRSFRLQLLLSDLERGFQHYDEAQIVVGLDIGTTFSGYAIAHKSNLKGILTFEDWPESTKPYSKTPTAIYYGPGNGATAKVNSWGWEAVHAHLQDMDKLEKLRAKSVVDLPVFGTFCSEFKPLPEIYGKFPRRKWRMTTEKQLPVGFTLTQVIADYLREIGASIMRHLRTKFSEGITMADVQWCVTVHSSWGNCGKKEILGCMVRSGLVRSMYSAEGSPHPVVIALESRAASCYCHRNMPDVELKVGDRLLVVDIGGVSTDVAVDTWRSELLDNYRGDRFSNYHILPEGGMNVDLNFFRKSLDDESFFNELFATSDSQCIGTWEMYKQREVYKQWEEIKCRFGDGVTIGESFKIQVPSEMAAKWKEFHKEHNKPPRSSYDILELTHADIEAIFEPVVRRILNLITQRNELTANLKVVLVVGGLGDSPYVLTKIKESFPRIKYGMRESAEWPSTLTYFKSCLETEYVTREKFISLVQPGSAVCKGAVIEYCGRYGWYIDAWEYEGHC